MADDGKREVHGVHIKGGRESRPKIVREGDTRIVIEGPIDIELGVASARHLAKTLYRLARRLEKRAASGIETVGQDPQGLGAKPR